MENGLRPACGYFVWMGDSVTLLYRTASIYLGHTTIIYFRANLGIFAIACGN